MHHFEYHSCIDAIDAFNLLLIKKQRQKKVDKHCETQPPAKTTHVNIIDALLEIAVGKGELGGESLSLL